LPSGARIAYADLRSLWAIDRDLGVRLLVEADGINTPQFSSDRRLIAYRVSLQDHMEVWAVSWDGGDPFLLLDERELPKEGLDAEHVERRIQDMRWVPGRAVLSLSLTAVTAPTAPAALPRTELWHLAVDTGALAYVTEMGQAYRPYYSPDGSRIALLQYGTEDDPRGTVALFDGDGGAGRIALQFPAGPAKPSYETQVAWLPDSRALWVAIPEADPATALSLNGTTLYRLPVDGGAEVVGSADAYQVAWSPDGRRLALTRAVPPSMETIELYLAAGDGSAPKLYATLSNGAFVSWSPDGNAFLYQDRYQTYVGAPGRTPQWMANGVSTAGPRWIARDQFVSLHDTGTGWWLTLRRIDGAAAGLLALPREAMIDVAPP
jgi:tricorn protease-like protein